MSGFNYSSSSNNNSGAGGNLLSAFNNVSSNNRLSVGSFGIGNNSSNINSNIIGNGFSNNNNSNISGNLSSTTTGLIKSASGNSLTGLPQHYHAQQHSSILVHTLWQQYLQSVVHQDALYSLVEFLKVFVALCNDTSPQLLPLTLVCMSIEDVSRNLSKRFVEELSGLLAKRVNTNELLNYFSGHSLAGEAPLLLCALDILTRGTAKGIPVSFGRLIIVLLHRLLTSSSTPLNTSSNLNNSNNNNNSNINNSNNSYVNNNINSNLNINNSINNNNYNNSYFGNNMDSFNHNNNSNSYQYSPSFSTASKQIPTAIPQFQSINSYFYLSPLPPSLMGIGDINSLNYSTSSTYRTNDKSSSSWSPPILSSIMSIPPPPLELQQQQLSSFEQQQQQSISSNNSGGSNPLSFNQEIVSNSSAATASYSNSINNNNSNNNNSLGNNANMGGNLNYSGSSSSLAALMNERDDQQHPRSTNELSPTTNVCYHLLRILGNLFRDRLNILEFLRSTDLLSILIEILTHQSHDPTFSPLIQSQVIRIFAQIMSSCCHSLESMSLIHEKKLIENLLNVLGEQEKQTIKLPVSSIIELSQVIVYTVKSSSRLMVLLHDDFDANNGYSILLNTFIYIADFGSLRNKLDIINVACNLLFIPLRKELYLDSSHSDSIYQPHNIAKTSLKVFNIFINVFSITTSEEMKTELLKCIKGIFYMSLAITSEQRDSNTGSQDNFDLINGNEENNIGIFHKLEPFKIFFSQFEHLNLFNRRLILDMMDELLLKNQIKELEIKFYVALLECKMPSTVLLVSQHMTDLLAKSKINVETLRKSGLLDIITRYLVDPQSLPFEQVLEQNPDELALCLQLIPGRHFPSSSNKLFVLYRIEISLLSLLLEFFSQSHHIQSLFVDSGGLKLLYKLLPDEYLIQQSLQVISTLAIGKLRIESKIITDLVEVLQYNGGATTLDSKVLTMRKNILAAMCYIFHNNYNAKNSFISAGGFTWCVSILDGISRCVNMNNLNSNTSASAVGNSSGFKSKNAKSTSNEIFFFLKVLIDTLSAVMKSNPDNQKYFREEIQFSTLSNTLAGCGYMEGVYSASLCDSLLNMAVSGSWPPSCEQHSLEEGSLLSVYSPISSFFPTNSSFSSKDFSIAIDKAQQKEKQQQQQEKQYLVNTNMESSLSLVENENQPQLVNVHLSNALSSPVRRGRSYTNDFERPTLSTTPPPIPSYTSLDLATEVRISGTPQINSTSKLPEKSSLALAQDRYFSCQQCRDSLTIENPEIFKLIIRLMGGTEEQIQKVESKSSCYILKEIIFLTNCSLFNMKTLSSLLIDIVDYFKPLLINNNNHSLFAKKKEQLKALLLELIQCLAGHNLTLQEFRKYFELLRVKDYPIDLLNLLVKVSNRDNLPTYYAEMSKSSLECIDIPSFGERAWPPLKGFGISFWFRFSSPVLKINKSPLFLFSMEGVAVGFRDKTCEYQIVLDNGVISYRIIHGGNTMEQHSFSEFVFDPDTFYHLCITHTGMGANAQQKKTPVKLYVNGFLRSQFGVTYPRTQMMATYVRFGGSNAALAFKDFYNITNWHLGNAYIFEDLPLDKEVFYLYLLGPDHFRGLKVDIASVENIQPPIDKHTKLHQILIDHLQSPTIAHLHSLHDKILSIFSAKCLRITKAHRIMNKSEAITHASAQPQQSSDSLTFLKRSASGRSILDSFGTDGSSSPSRTSLSITNSTSSVSSSTPSSLAGSTLTRRDSRSTLNEHLDTQSIMSTSAMSTIASVIGGAIAPAKVNNIQQLSANYVSLLQTGLPTPLPPGVICQRGIKDQVSDCGGVSVIIYLMAISSDKEYQRSSLRLLQSVVANHQQNTLDMKEIYGYQLVSHLIRKKRWPLDEGLLSILFSFVGVQSTRTSSHFINGVVQNVLALKHFLLEWDIWRRASLVDQKKLFESLDKLVSGLHENYTFNIIKFRQAGAFEIILKICREDDVPLEIIPLLMSILDSIKHQPSKIKDDLQLLISYLLETSPKGKPTGQARRKKSNTYLIQAINNNNNQFALDANNNASGNSSFTTPLSTSPPSSGQSTPTPATLHETMRISILTLLLDILSRSDHSVIEEFHSICSLESIFGLLVNESVPIRILFLKVIELFLKVPSINTLFQKMKGFHLLGHQLLSYPLTEEIFGVLFCILFGKPYNNEISVKNYFKSISKDWELKYPGVLITILMILCNCTFDAQHIVIKIIHHTFVHDQFSSILLDQELIQRLVDILSNNFVKRKNHLFSQAFNRNMGNNEFSPSSLSSSSSSSSLDLLQQQKEESWKSEEAILLLLNEIALYGVKNQDGNLLRDILVILHLNSKMDYEYICFLQRKIMQNVITFFTENHSFVSVESLVSSFEKISILTINTLCYQDKQSASAKKSSDYSFPGNSTNNSILPTKFMANITSSPDSAPHTPRSATTVDGQTSDMEHYQFGISSNDESTEDSDSSDAAHYHHKKRKSYIQEWIKEANLFSNDSFITTLIIALSNKKLPHNISYLNPFSTQYSARSLLGKLIFLLLTNPDYSDWHLLTISLLIGIDTSNLGSVNNLSVASLPTVPSPPLSVLDEDFSVALLHITQRFLHRPDDDPLYKVTTKLWYMVYQSGTPDFLKKVFDCQHWSTTDTKEILKKYQSQYAENEYKKWEERLAQSKKEWNLQYLETQKNKRAVISKNQDITKSTKKLTESLLQLKAQTEKSSITYYYQTKESKRFFHNQWKELIKKVTHERAIWEITPSNKWRLDPTEGSNRMRNRMKRITQRSEMNHLAIPSELTKTPSSTSVRSTKDELHHSTNNLHNSHESYSSFDNLMLGEKVNGSYTCACISPFYQRNGELIIGDANIYFMDELLSDSSKNQQHQQQQNNNAAPGKPKRSVSTGKHITMSYEDIIEIHKRRHVLKNSAIEIFLGSGVPHKTYLFAFNKPSDRDLVYDQIMSKQLPNRVDYAAEVQGNIFKLSITKKWQHGLISNFEYLMHLNTLAGRSFNDLTQYPIFPFILRDYESEELDLESPDTFRDLTKPMGAQDPQRLKKFVEKFNYLQETNEKPYHYGSHYSNIGSVLHFLVRLQPFSSYFIDFQGGRFDVPDRAFHSISQSWRLSSSISSSDVKELIPEFFYMPEFLVNSNQFDMGIKQDGIRVDDVVLPPWAKNDPRLFIKKHLEALESKYVSENLNHWIDLMFGYKQQGEAAVKAFNMFFPLTYEGAVDIDTIEDQLTRDATIAQIHSYGQTPKQLFTKPHPQKSWRKSFKTVQDAIYTNPQKLTQYPMWSIRNPVGFIGISGDTPIPLSSQKILLYPDTNKYVSWGHWDQNLRICSCDTGKVISLIEVVNDDIICCDITKNGRVFVTGGTSGTIKVWKRSNSDGTFMTRKERGDNLKLWSKLYGHTDSILCITVSQEFSVILSGSKDHTCIIWDINRLSYVMSLPHDNPVTCVQVSPTTNYTATAETNVTGDYGALRLWSPKGDLISRVPITNDRINCMTFTSGIEGAITNLLITGMESGKIVLWNAWNLTKIRVLSTKNPVTALGVSKDHTQLIVGDATGTLECWSSKSFDGYSALVG